MSSEQVPNIFAGLFLSKGQYDLFEEVEEEAIDLFGSVSSEDSGQEPDGVRTILIDSTRFRLAVTWATLSEVDLLSLAIGAHRSDQLSREDIQDATDMMGSLFRRAEALFEVQRSVWQIAIAPLTAETMRAHAKSLGSPDVRSGDVHFLSFKPNRAMDTATAEPKISSSELLKNMQAAGDEDSVKSSWAMQASALAMSTAFVFVTPPVGIAMLTYAALRQGNDMDLFSSNADDDGLQGDT